MSQRSDSLKDLLKKLNEDLPNNVYIPIKNFNGHRVLNVSLDYCICLHSNEKAPFHILIEVENISLANIQNNLINEIEETKRQNHSNKEAVLKDSNDSQNSEENDESTSLKLSNENKAITSYEDSDNDSDDSRILPFTDHYAEDILGRDTILTQQLETRHTLKNRKYEESKLLFPIDAERSKTMETLPSIKDSKANCEKFEYQLARVSKKKPSLIKKIL